MTNLIAMYAQTGGRCCVASELRISAEVHSSRSRWNIEMIRSPRGHLVFFLHLKVVLQRPMGIHDFKAQLMSVRPSQAVPEDQNWWRWQGLFGDFGKGWMFSLSTEYTVHCTLFVWGTMTIFAAESELKNRHEME